MLKGKWTKEEESYLKENYGKKTAKECAETLERSIGSTRTKANKLGLLSVRQWTKEMEEELTYMYLKGKDIKEIAKHLGKSVVAIRDKLTKMGIRNPIEVLSWSIEEEKFLIENYTELGPSACAEKLNRTYNSVQHKANKDLKLRQYEHNIWTEEEKDFLREYFPDKLGYWCADKLGRSFHAVHKMTEKLGIKPNWKYVYHDDNGYVVYCHDRENKIFEHRYVVEQFIGRKLSNEEIIHHINEVKDDNRLENLMITTRLEHNYIHSLPLEERNRIEQARKLG